MRLLKLLLQAQPEVTGIERSNRPSQNYLQLYAQILTLKTQNLGLTFYQFHIFLKSTDFLLFPLVLVFSSQITVCVLLLTETSLLFLALESPATSNTTYRNSSLFGRLEDYMNL